MVRGPSVTPLPWFFSSPGQPHRQPHLKAPVMSPMWQHLVWRPLERPMMLPLTDYAAMLSEAIAEMPHVPAWHPPKGPMIPPLTNYAVTLSEALSEMPLVVSASVLSSKPPTRQFLVASWSP
ncbi:hypothetical protein IscW_ISCW018790 [Ixodes scapularis]|uniref:Uncharacterized protein n=1 Tax=Ixodes scapularis TaxID=6945 RepID=B7PLK1_IXOSC|nr:hypothetical protein IscW_ISCW018790 [Ixodes scapularis]|eukprot:XP_002434649.1 hypothetical protein IscW_ISCW018790 [Ixodes scapularis]